MTDQNPLGFSDAARRCSDTVNNHIAGLGWSAFGKWVAIRLSDGGSDDTVYDTRADAIRHQLHETQCCYVQIPPTGMPVAEAESFITFNRNLYNGGFRITDPETPQIHMPQEFRVKGANQL